MDYWNEFFGRFFCRPEEPNDKEKTIADMQEQQQKLKESIRDLVQQVAKLRNDRNVLVFSEPFLRDHEEIKKLVKDL